MFDDEALGRLSDARLVEVICAWERLAARAAAGQFAAVAELARRRPPVDPSDQGQQRVPSVSEFAVDEVAAALRLSRPAAGVRLYVAVELTTRLPGTAAALRSGVLDLPKVRAVVDATAPLGAAAAAAVEARVLPRAGRQTVGQLRASLARAVLAVDPADAEVRHTRAAVDRRVTVSPLPDGMAELWAVLPADGATAVYSALDTLARCPRARDDLRGIDARRADALVELALIAVPRSAGGARAAESFQLAAPVRAAVSRSVGGARGAESCQLAAPARAADSRSVGGARGGESFQLAAPARAAVSRSAGGARGAESCQLVAAVRAAVSRPVADARGERADAPAEPDHGTAGAAAGAGAGAQVGSLSAPAAPPPGAVPNRPLPGVPPLSPDADAIRAAPDPPAAADVDTCSPAPPTRVRPGSTPPRRLRADVHVTVPAGTLLGLTDEPGELAGYGPVPASMARRLAGTGTWRRILTDPATGAVLDVGRRRYVPPAPLAEHIIVRDRTCRFPGCRQPAWRCDLDHTVPFPYGPTSPANLAAICRHHHRLKHLTGWRVEQPEPGHLTWTSPTGHRYTTGPPVAGVA